MKLNVSLLATLLSLIAALACSDLALGGSLSLDQIKGVYIDIFALKKVTDGEGFWWNLEVVPPTDTGRLAAFVKENSFFLDYLLKNGTSFSLKDVLSGGGDEEEVKARFRRLLCDDPRFDSLLLPTLTRWLSNCGDSLDEEGYSRLVTRHILLSEVVSLAVRFFYPDASTSQGFQMHICLGLNGFADYAGSRDLAVEAFTFSAIFRNLTGEKQDVIDDVGKCSQALGSLKLSSDSTVAVHRAQGAMWAMMSQSKALRAAILKEYDRTKSYMPFVVDED
jgi:hypothetical protein